MPNFGWLEAAAGAAVVAAIDEWRGRRTARNATEDHRRRMANIAGAVSDHERGEMPEGYRSWLEYDLELDARRRTVNVEDRR